MPAANLIKTEDLTDAKLREIDFVERFQYSIAKLVEALGITRKIAKEAGTVLKTYKATGTLEDGNVAEGETIPLSKYKIEAVDYKEITLKKWRKATTAENILKYGYDQAVNMTTDEMLHDVQKGIRANFFGFLGKGTGSSAGANLKKVLANATGKLLALYDSDDVETVHFANPITVYDYLGEQEVSTQTAFGMKYIENFLGCGTVFMNSSVPEGAVYSTVSENLVLYYIPTDDSDLGEVFDFMTDETGYVGIHEVPDYTNLTCDDTVVSGIELFAEKLDGVLVGTITQETEQTAATQSETSYIYDNGEDYTSEALNAMTIAQIKTIAEGRGYTIANTLKADIINEFLAQQAG